MAITFSCGQCGKDYAVSEGLAGKRALCKACGNRMLIPGTPPEPARAAAPARPAAPRPAPAPAQARPAPAQAQARPVSGPPRAAQAPPRPAPAAAPARKAEPSFAFDPVEDAYGFNDAPSALPPMRFGAAQASAAGADAVESPIKKKKKKKGFFSSSGSKSSKGYGRGDGISFWQIRIVIAVVVGIIGAIGGFGLMSKSQMQNLATQMIDLANETTRILRPVQNAGQAAAASAQVKNNLNKICQLLRDSKGKKANQAEIEEIQRQFGTRIQSAYFDMGREIGRITTIPGGRGALAVDLEFQQMLTLAQEAAQE